MHMARSPSSVKGQGLIRLNILYITSDVDIDVERVYERRL